MKHHPPFACAVLVAWLAAGATSGAATLHTPVMQAGSDQILVCTVVNLAGTPMRITAELVDRWGDNVTCFVRTDWDETGSVLLTLHAEATNPNARYCRVVVHGGRKANVAVSLQACTFDLTTCTAPVVGH
jgi:hypothetical protein